MTSTLATCIVTAQDVLNKINNQIKHVICSLQVDVETTFSANTVLICASCEFIDVFPRLLFDIFIILYIVLSCILGDAMISESSQKLKITDRTNVRMLIFMFIY